MGRIRYGARIARPAAQPRARGHLGRRRGPRRSSPSTRPIPTRSRRCCRRRSSRPTEPLVRVTIATVDLGRRAARPSAPATFAVERDARGHRRLVPAGHADDHRAVGHRRARDLRRAEEARPRSRSTATATGSRGTVRPARHDASSRSPARVGEHARADPTAPRTDFYFKFLPAPDGKGFDDEPALVYCHRDETTRKLERVDGRGRRSASRGSTRSPTSRCARSVRIDVAERRSVQTGRVVGTVPGRLAAPVRAPALRRPLARRRGLTTMQTTSTGRVAVVTGGAGGIGRAMGERVRARGHEGRARRRRGAGARRRPVAELRADGARRHRRRHRRHATTTSVEALRDAALDALRRGPRRCATTPASAPAPQGTMWEHELNDWRWALGVNVWGVIHGIKAFVPAMLDQRRARATSSTRRRGNGGIVTAAEHAALRRRRRRRSSRSPSRSTRSCRTSARTSAPRCCSPGPHMLRTGLFESWRNRPDEFAKERPRQTPYTHDRGVRGADAAAGVDLDYTPVEEVADRGRRRRSAPTTFWILPPSERTDEQIRARAAVDARPRRTPTYLRADPGEKGRP